MITSQLPSNALLPPLHLVDSSSPGLNYGEFTIAGPFPAN